MEVCLGELWLKVIWMCTHVSGAFSETSGGEPQGSASQGKDLHKTQYQLTFSLKTGILNEEIN